MHLPFLRFLPLEILNVPRCHIWVACPEPRHGHGQVCLTALSFSSLLCTCRQGTWLDAGRNNCISHSQQHGCRSLGKDLRCCCSNLQVRGEDLGPVTPLLAPILACPDPCQLLQMEAKGGLHGFPAVNFSLFSHESAPRFQESLGFLRVVLTSVSFSPF